MPDLIYNKERILELINAQKSVPGVSFTEARDIENRSVTFLYGYAKGSIGLSEDAKELISEYFEVLDASKNLMIRDSLEDAQKKFYEENTEDTNTPQEDLDKPASDNEKKQTNDVDWFFSDEAINHYTELSHKNYDEFTPSDYLFLASFLSVYYNNADTDSKKDALLSKLQWLQNRANEKIEKIINGDERTDDGNFPNMVEALGTDEQKEFIRELVATYQQDNRSTSTQNVEDETITELDSSASGTMAENVDTPTQTPVEEEVNTPTQTPVEEEINTPVQTPVEEDVIDTPIQTPVEEEVNTPIQTPVEEEVNTPTPTPVVEPIPQPVVNKPKKSSKNSTAKPAKTGELPLDAIVFNSKKLAAMNAQELLEIAERIEKLPNEKQKRRMKSAFRYFIIQKLDNPKKLDLTEKGLDVLARDFGTEKQRKMFNISTPQPQTAAPETTKDSKPVIEILPPHDEETIEFSASKPKKDEEKVDDTAKSPWYKRAVAKVIFVGTIFIGAITAFAGISKSVFGSDKTSDSDNAPTTEVKKQAEAQPKQGDKSIHFDKARAAQADAESYKAEKTEKTEDTKKTEETKKVEEIKKIEQAKQDIQAKKVMLTKEDAKCVKRTSKFLKKIAQNHNISIEEAQQRLNDFVNNLDLPQGVSSHRMSYLASIHALFPNSEFGITANKIFDGENIQVSKEDIKKLDNEFSKPGDFGHKNNKYNTTLQVAKQIKSNIK